MNFTETNPIELGDIDWNRHVFSYEVDRDPQGILWNTEYFISTREDFRRRRNNRYNSFRNTVDVLKLEDQCSKTNNKYFNYIENHLIESEFSHFQLRNNVQCLGQDDIFMKTFRNNLTNYNPVNYEKRKVLNPRFTAVSFYVLGENVVVGGMEGELILCDKSGNVKFDKEIGDGSSKITNSCAMFMECGETSILTCNNDKKIRILSPETQETKLIVGFDECVNHGTLSNDKKIIVACLDSVEDRVVDKLTGEVVGKTSGHSDFSFSAAWDPSSDYYFATGNQDHSVIVWDLRTGPKYSPLHVLKGRLSATLCVKYSSNGKYLAFSETADYITIIDKKDYKQRQVIDYFGEISGFDFCEDAENSTSIFLALADSKYSSLVELRENKGYDYLV